MEDDGSTHSALFGDLSTEEVTSKIILTAIIVLFLAVLFVLILHLYAKLYWWRVDQLQQQQQQQQQQEPIAPPPVARQRRRFIFVPGQDAHSNSGLSPFELSSLPIVFFRQDSCCKDGLECAICLSELVKGDQARLLPKCNHTFHVECIDMWFHSHSTCPICRNPVLAPHQPTSKRVEQVPDNANLEPHSRVATSLSTSSPDFPTNVLVWGRQDQVSTGNSNVATQEDTAVSQSQEALVLAINDSSVRTQNLPSSSSSSVRYIVEEEDSKSPMTTRLRSLKRFLSRDKRVACSTCSTSGSSSSNAAASAEP